MTSTPSVDELSAFLADVVDRKFQRAKGVVGVSGGIDSAVTLALTSRALGPERTLGVLMPERESSSKSLELGIEVCNRFNVPYEVRDLTSALEGIGCYRARDEAVSALIPEYESGDELRVVLHQDLRRSRLPARYSIEVVKLDGQRFSKRPTIEAYRHIFAASNFKQRLRTVSLYYVAERDNAAVIGTSNLDETYLGFFVKIGDDTWDVGPLSHLPKWRVQELAVELGVPQTIIDRPTTTDTFPVEEQSQEEMFYAVTFNELDAVLGSIVDEVDPDEVAQRLGWTSDEVANAAVNLRRRHKSTEWNRLRGLTFEQ